MLVLGSAAHATSFNALPGDFYTAPANGTLTFTFEGFSAADTDLMNFNGNPLRPIFTNQSASPGDVFTESVIAGVQYELTLDNYGSPPALTPLFTWSSDPSANTADGDGGTPHLVSTAIFGDFGIGAPFGPGVSTNCALPGQQCYLGWEDLPTGGDKDYNDLVFALQFTRTSVPETSVPETSVPEPATLVLLGSGLLGLCLIRRRRNRA
jgi:hypothetical protein